jgi:hypothetical protein
VEDREDAMELYRVGSLAVEADVGRTGDEEPVAFILGVERDLRGTFDCALDTEAVDAADEEVVERPRMIEDISGLGRRGTA